MRKMLLTLAILCFSTVTALGAQPARWLHVSVVSPEEGGQTVRVNVPMDLAEKVLPAINAGNLHEGKVKICGDVNGIDVPTLLDAIRTAPDNQYVSVDNAKEKVLVSKANGNLLIKITPKKGNGDRVDVKVPIAVVAAMFSGSKNNELDVLAGIRALRAMGDIEIVTVNDGEQTVHVWTDSRNDMN